MKPNKMEIKTLEDIKNISKKRTNNTEFKLQFLNDSENNNWEIKFNTLLSDCGCDTGRRYMIVVVPFILTLSVLIWLFFHLSIASIGVLFMITSVLIGILGKIIGLRDRNKKIKELIQVLIQEIYKSKQFYVQL